MLRLFFLLGTCFFALSCGAQTQKAPFKLLYSNDCTNLESCVAPFHAEGEPFSLPVLYASIDEAVDAGADAYLLQPGFLYVPLWNSKIYPAKPHFEWFYKTFSRTPHTGFADYMMAGGDLVRDYLDYCKKKGVAAFVSLRVNDYHATENLDAKEGARLHPHAAMSVDRFRREHPELRVGAWTGVAPNRKNIFAVRETSVMDWAHPEVRARALGLVAEVAAYPVDGIELDFLRHFRLFNPLTTTTPERVKIVTEWVGAVRKALDARQGARRWLCVRIPAQKEVQDAMGLDIAALRAAGVDMFNLSSNYYTVQDGMRLDENRAAAPDAAMYLEMTHVTMVGADPKRTSGDSNFYRRTTDAQFAATAALAYAAGFDGVSLFNFAYYREYGNKPERGPFAEPPFRVFKTIADKAAAARAPRYYFLAPVWRSPYGNPVQLPARLGIGRDAVLSWELRGGVGGDARVRVQFLTPLAEGTHISAEWDGKPLQAVADISEPYPSTYPHLLGTPETLRAWKLPRALATDGKHRLTLRMTAGENALVYFAEITAPAP